MTKVTRLTVDDDGQIQSRRIHLREISGDSDAPLETVGQDLRAARLRRGEDLATVAKALKIRKDHLEAIEEDRLDSLPGRTYAVGFVRSYATYLGLDTTQCVERFKAEIAGRTDAENQPQVQVIDEDDQRRLPQGWKIIAVVVVLLMLYGAYWVLTSTSTSIPVPQPPQSTNAPALAPAPPPHRQASVPPATAPAVTPPAPNATTTDPNAPQPGAEEAAPAAEAPLPQGTVYGQFNSNSRVVLRVHQPTRILVQGPDGKVYINRTLQRGDTYNVPNIVGAKLTTTNANAVEVDLDGQAMGFAGRDSGIAEAVSLDPQSIVDRSAGGPG
ncbi:MAG: helix-turn-helix domain-containing protein [Alphaproteobacteria bacterium]|nr:helix-turn-helix domain-containing protein [Alphaproteobacteria bacterium]